MVGAVLAFFFMKRGQPVAPPPPFPEPPTDPKTLEELEKRKIQLVAEQEAFQKLMSYNTDTAYGRGDDL